MDKKGFLFSFIFFCLGFFFIGSVKAFTTSDNQVFPDFPNNTQEYQYTIFTDSNGNYKLIEIPNGSLIIANNLRIMNNNLYIVYRNTKLYIIQNNEWVYDSSPNYNSYIGFTDIIASTVSIHQRLSNGGVDISTYLYPAFYNFSSHTGFFDTVNANSWVYNQKFFDIVFNNLYTIRYYGTNPAAIINKEDYPYVAISSYSSGGYLYFKVLFSDCNNLDKSGNNFIASKSCNYFYTQWSESTSDKTHISGSFNGSYRPPNYTFTFDNTIVATNTDWYYNGTKKVSKNVDYSPSGIQSYTVNFHLNGGNVIDLSNPLVPNYINLDYQIETTTEELEEYLGDITIYKDNNDFAGWYYDANFTQSYTPGDILSSDIDLYAKWVSNLPDYLNGFKKVDLNINDKYVMISYVDNGSVFIPSEEFFEYGGRLSYFDQDLDTQPYSSYIQDFTEMSDGRFVKQDFDLSTYNGSDWIMFSKYIYLEGEDNISYSIYVPNDAYIGEVSITPNQLGGNDFDFTYKDENGDIQNGQVISQDLGFHNIIKDNVSLSDSFNFFTKPVRFIIQSITNLYNNYLSAALQKYFYILFTLVIVILITRVIF